MNAKEALRWMENDTGIMSCNDDAWPIVIRALRLLAAAEANDGRIPEMTKAVQEGRGIELGCQFERERNGLAARVRELEKELQAHRVHLVEAIYGHPCPTPRQWEQMQEVAVKAMGARGSKP